MRAALNESNESVASLLSAAGVLAVAEVRQAAEAVSVAEALLGGGVRAMEIAFRDVRFFDESERAIAAVRERCPQMLVGAATVVNPAIADRALASGAQFVLSAGFNPKTVEHCVARGIPIVPGVCTPGEIEQALEFGLTTLKFFPAEVCGGTAMLSALSGPYPQVRFVASGGIGASNAASYLACRNVAAVSGSWVSPKSAIFRGDFSAITALAAEASAQFAAQRTE